MTFVTNLTKDPHVAVCKSEKDVKRAVKRLLDKHGWYWWMIPANGYGKSGTSDFHALRDGVFIAVETKFAGNKPTPLQIGFLNSIASGGAFAFVVSDVTLTHFARWLELFDATTKAVAERGTISDHAGAEMLDCIREMTKLFA